MYFHHSRWSDHIITCSTFQVLEGDTVYLFGVTGSTIPAVVTTTENYMRLVFTSIGSTIHNSAIYNWQATYTAV
jgi:hypothetical protein